MKTYEVVFDKNKNKGVYGISLVENPAMEGNFIALSKEEKVQLTEINKDKQLLLGLVLEPNKPIYRNQGGEEFNITFTPEVVTQLAHNFQEQGYQNNSTLEHEDTLQLKDVTFAESWIVEDVEKDKQANFGLSYPKGSWLVMMKINNKDMWNTFIKTGAVKGFSVDALVNLKEVKLKTEIEMSEVKVDEGFWTKFKAVLSEVLPSKEEVKEEVKTELEEVKEPIKEEVKEIETKAEEVKEEIKEEVKEELSSDELLKNISEALAGFKEEIKAELKAVKDENVKLSEQVIELGKKPVRNPIKSEVSQRELTAYEKYKAEKEDY